MKFLVQLILFVILFIPNWVYSQVTITTTATTTTFWSSTGPGVVVFGLSNTNPIPYVLTDLSNYVPAASTVTYSLWYNPTTVVGAPGEISTANGWTELPVTTTITGPATAGIIPIFSNINLTIPAGATYRIAFVTNINGPYYATSGASPNLFSSGGIDLHTQNSTISPTYSGPFPGPPTTTPRGFYGSVSLSPAAPCIAPPTAGTTVSSNSLVCAGASAFLSLSGATIASGLSYQWQSGPSATGPWTNLVNDTLSTNTETVTTPTYFQCIVTCSGQSATSTPVFVDVTPNLPAGTYTIGATGNYANFTAAVAALSCGIAGPVIFNVLPNSGPYNEQITIPSILNSSSVNTITFNGNGNTISFDTPSSAPAVIALNGADYVTFNDLVVTSTNVTQGHGFLLTNNADNNGIIGCTINVSATATSTTLSTGVAITGSLTSATTAGASGSNLVITGNTINGGFTGISVYGPATTFTQNNTISFNTINDNYSYGIRIVNASFSQILNNTIKRPTRSNTTTIYGISLATGGENNLIESNKIHNLFDALPTSTSGAYGIYSTGMDASVGNENKAVNNLIYNINHNGAIYGLYNTGSDNVKYYHNTVSLDHSASTAGATYGFYQTTLANNLDLKNNIFTVTRGGTGVKYALYFATATTTFTSNNNIFYVNSAGTGTQGIGFLSAAQATLAAWQTASGGDLFSYALDPQYTNTAIGDFTPTNTGANSIGVPVGVTTDILGNLRSLQYPDPGAYEFGTSTPVLCSGIPTAGTAAANNQSLCVSSPSAVNFSLTGYTTMPGIEFQWQQSSTLGGPYTDVTTGTGATTPNYTSAVISTTSYFVCKVICTGSNQFALSNEIAITVNNPTLTSTQGGSLCGVGSVALNATPAGSSTVNWYENQTGGIPVFTGSAFNTPVISNNTTYYAAASTGGNVSYGGKPAPVSTATGYSAAALPYGLVFDAIQAFTLVSVEVYSSAAAGDLTMVLTDNTGSIIQTIGPISIPAGTGTTIGGGATPTTIPINVSVPAGTGYRLYTTNLTATLIRENTGGFPFPLGTAGNVSTSWTNGAASTANYYFFYNWQISTGCDGIRVPVTATITSAPLITGSSNISSVCSGNNATLSVSSTNANYTYTWSPSNQTGSSVTVNPTIPTEYVVTAIDNSTGTFAGCTNVDTVSINVQPTVNSIDLSPEEHCLTGSSVLTLNPSTGYSTGSVEWQTSTNNSTYTIIAGANGVDYTTPTLTSTTYYKAIVKDANGATCNEMIDSVAVNNPQLVSTTAGESCGPNTVLLSASGAGGSNINWYTTPTGGAPFNTGNTFNTPFIFNSTTYYAAASTGGGITLAGRVNPFATSTGFTGNDYGLVFSTSQPFVLTSVDIYPTATAGSITIQLTNSSGVVLETAGPFTIPAGTGTTFGNGATPVTLSLNLNVPIGTDLRLRSAAHTGSIVRDNPIGTNFSYPLPIGNFGQITAGLLANAANVNTYYYFYNWQIGSGCESARVPVEATIFDLPTVSLGNDTSFCDNTSLNLDAGNHSSYTWSTGANTQSISVNTSGTYSVIVTDTNACSNTDSIAIVANPSPNPVLGDLSNCTGQAETLDPGVSPIGNSFNWSSGQNTPTISVNTSGTYIVTVTNDGSGCSGVDTAIVSINTAQAIGLSDAIVCDYNSITLTVPSSFTNVSWSTGATGNSVTIAGSSLPAGANNITINAIDANGCATMQTIVLTVDRCLSVSERANSNQIKVYPNPSSGKINIEAKNISSAILEVIDLNGRVLLTQKLGNDVKLHNVDLTGASSGMYFLKITGDGFQNVERITIR